MTKPFVDVSMNAECKVEFRIDNQTFTLDYEVYSVDQFKFMKKCLLDAFEKLKNAKD